MFFGTVGTLFAGTTGTITGTLTDLKTNLPLADVNVVAVAPTGKYTTKTNAQGFFAFTGVSPDTYTVSYQHAGYQDVTLTGVNVFADQTANVSATLQKSLSTIARITARSQGGAFQPNQTEDTYTVTSSQIETIQGKAFATSETNLLAALPGVTTDSSGYPVLRGGRENEEGFQFEGIDYTDAFTNQFVNSLAINGAASVQLTPGGGDASTGNAGTGTINIIAKRGTYPAFGSLDFEANAYPFQHQFGAEYGFATPSNRFSNYFSYIGQRDGSQIGEYGANSTPLLAYYSRSFEKGDDFVDNMVFRFGHNNNQSVQLFYQTQTYDFYDNYGGINNLNYKSADPYFLANVKANLPYLSTADIQNAIGFYPGQTAAVEPLDQISHTVQPNATYKIQYSNNLDASTFLTAKYYRVNATPVFSLPFDTNAFGGTNEENIVQGGQQTGVTLDITKQLDSKNLIGIGGKYVYLHPVNSFADPSLGFLAASGFSHGFEVLDFLPGGAGCAAGQNLTAFFGVPNAGCGYLSQYFPNGVPRVPAFDQSSPTNRQDRAFYLQDTYTPNSRLKFNVGIRMDGANYQFPSLDSGLYNVTQYPGSTLPSDVQNPTVFEPRGSVSLQLSKNDAIRFSYQRSVIFPFLADVNSYVPPAYYNKFSKIPSYDNTTGLPAMYCGVGAVTGLGAGQQCKSYADQLYWENQFQDGIPVQPALPSTYNNFDFSYSHEFPAGVGMKVTPFYRRGYNAIALVSLPLLNTDGTVRTDSNGNTLFGPSQTTNLGTQFTTGVEFELTKEAAYGLSGSFNATYINEFSNTPPLTNGEDFFPGIPAPSLALGNIYRVGFLTPLQATLALQYKTHYGLRLNPVIQYQRGYPLGEGLYTAAFINGVAQNVPQTNITQPTGSTGATQYVCPTNPGTIANPNICATRGFTEGASAGGFLSNATLNTNMTVEYSTPGSHNTFGLTVFNVFNQLYSGPVLNPRFQPVANGIGGPKTGTSSNPINYPNEGFTQYGPAVFGQTPYLNFPNNTPTQVRLYYQVGL